MRGKLRAELYMGNANSSASNKSDIFVEADGSDVLATRMMPDAIEGEFVNSNINFLPVSCLRSCTMTIHSGDLSGLVWRQIDESWFIGVRLSVFTRSY